MVNVFFVVVIDILDRQIQGMVLLSESPHLYFFILSIDYHGTDQYTEIYNWKADMRLQRKRVVMLFYWTGHWTIIIVLLLSLNYRRHGHHRSIQEPEPDDDVTNHHRMSDIAGHSQRSGLSAIRRGRGNSGKIQRMSWNSSNGSSCAVVTIGSQQSTLFCHHSTFN